MSKSLFSKHKMDINTQNFIYPYKNYDGNTVTISYPINIPFIGDENELAHQICQENMDEIMQFIDETKRLKRELRHFLNVENQKYYDDSDEELINQFINNKNNGDTVAKNLEKLYKEEILEFADRFGPSDDEIFAQSYHHLVHSPILPELLVRETTFATTVREFSKKMDSQLNTLINLQEVEVKKKLQELDVSATSDDINKLISRQYDKRELIQHGFQSELEAIRGHQKNKHRTWITSEIGANIVNSPIPTPIGNKSSMFIPQGPSMEESFTIHLGSQLKHMHNIRILSANITDLCSPLHENESLSGMNIALGLYSSSLCGVVILTPSGNVNMNREILKNANMSTDFHFDQIDNQLDKIENDLAKHYGDDKPGRKLRSGDFILTKHSNLSQAHLIFHLIADEPFQNSTEINSRHPIILGLRNILKVASKHDVTMLTIPALLSHEMSEDMTVSWCMRRAELVFKCAKGFMIESASWGGTELSTLQLLLPHNISEELFTSLAGMVPTVFRVANPKIF